ncbi:MAG TPA: hypothetical protein VIL29_08765 [Pseudothermotoga sp.]
MSKYYRRSLIARIRPDITTGSNARRAVIDGGESGVSVTGQSASKRKEFAEIEPVETKPITPTTTSTSRTTPSSWAAFRQYEAATSPPAGVVGEETYIHGKKKAHKEVSDTKVVSDQTPTEYVDWRRAQEKLTAGVVEETKTTTPTSWAAFRQYEAATSPWAGGVVWGEETYIHGKKKETKTTTPTSWAAFRQYEAATSPPAGVVGEETYIHGEKKAHKEVSEQKTGRKVSEETNWNHFTEMANEEETISQITQEVEGGAVGGGGGVEYIEVPTPLPVFPPSYYPYPPYYPYQPETGFDFFDWIQKNWIYILIGGVILILIIAILTKKRK